MHVQPYLCLEGRCQEAIEFYQQALGAEVLGIRRFSDAPGGPAPGMDPGKVMHACLKVGSTEIFMGDGMMAGELNFKGFSLTLMEDSDEQARSHFEALSQGGEIKVALNPTFFASTFGICTDKFGVSWMVMVVKVAVPA